MHFLISKQHIAGNDSKFTKYLSRHPVKSGSTEEFYEEEFVNINLTEMFKKNYNCGQLTNRKRKHRSTGQSQNRVSTTIMSSTNEIEQPKVFILEVKPKQFTRERTQKKIIFWRIFNPIQACKTSEQTHSETEKTFNYNYQQWAASTKNVLALSDEAQWLIKNQLSSRFYWRAPLNQSPWGDLQ